MQAHLRASSIVLCGTISIGYEFPRYSLRERLDEIEVYGSVNGLWRWRFKNFKNS